jgi:hypothetical protein
MTTTTMPLDSAAWLTEVLEELDAGTDAQVVAMLIQRDSPMLLPVVLNHLAWELARAAIAADPEGRQQYPRFVAEVPASDAATRASQYAQVFLFLADPNFRRPKAPVRKMREATPSEAPPRVQPLGQTPATENTPAVLTPAGERMADALFAEIVSDVVARESDAGRTPTLDEVRRALLASCLQILSQKYGPTLGPAHQTNLANAVDGFIARSADRPVAASVEDTRSAYTGMYL